MDPAEIEFLAEKERIDIIPNFSHGSMHLIQVLLLVVLLPHPLPHHQGDVGPFKPGLSVSCTVLMSL